MNEIFEKTKRELVISGLSGKTQKTYLRCLKKVSEHFKKSLTSLTTDEVKDYLYTIINDKKLSFTSINHVYCAFKFFFTRVSANKEFIATLPRFKIPQRRLPNVLARSEVKDLINCVSNLKHKCMLFSPAILLFQQDFFLKNKAVDKNSSFENLQAGENSLNEVLVLATKTRYRISFDYIL